MRTSLVILVFTVTLSGTSVCQESALPTSVDVKTEQKIDALLKQMTVEEKISQVTDGWGSAGIPRHRHTRSAQDGRTAETNHHDSELQR